jgi:hypothetical protein
VSLPDLVEPLCGAQAWVRSDHSVRLTLQLRPADKSIMYALMDGAGAREAAFARYVFQRGLETLVLERFENV